MLHYTDIDLNVYSVMLHLSCGGAAGEISHKLQMIAGGPSRGSHCSNFIIKGPVLKFETVQSGVPL